MKTKRMPCPLCSPNKNDKSMSVTATEDEKILLWCFRCNADWRELARAMGDELPSFERLPDSSKRQRWSDKAEWIWGQGRDVWGSVVQTYLEGRGCHLPNTGDVRFLPARGSFPQTMLSRITDARTTEPMSLHFTPMVDGGRGDRRLMGGHQKKGGVIRLRSSPNPKELVVAEGIETALTITNVAPDAEVWATIDSGNMRLLPVIESCMLLHIYVDSDAPGWGGAHCLSSTWQKEGRAVRLYSRETIGADMNDIVTRM